MPIQYVVCAGALGQVRPIR